MWKWQLLLHRAVLHYKIFPAFNTRHIFTVPCAIEHFETIKPCNWQLATGNWQLSHVFPTFESFDWRSYKRTFLVPYFISKPLHCWCQAFTMVPNKHLNHGWANIRYSVYDNIWWRLGFKPKHVVIYVFNKAHWDIVANEGLLYLFIVSIQPVNCSSCCKSWTDRN
jgi:hypothetical protein